MPKKLIFVSLSFFLLMALAKSGNKEILSSEINSSREGPSLYKLADRLADLLLSVRNVVALNQDAINMCACLPCPNSGKYTFKGLTPAVIGTQVGADFFLRTGIKMKQTSLRIRNPRNEPDDWERQVLERFEAEDYPRGIAFAQTVEENGQGVYRYMKPIYVEKHCLPCHSKKEEIREEIRKYLEANYPGDSALSYKEGDLRGGISIIIPVTE